MVGPRRGRWSEQNNALELSIPPSPTVYTSVFPRCSPTFPGSWHLSPFAKPYRFTTGLLRIAANCGKEDIDYARRKIDLWFTLQP